LILAVLTGHWDLHHVYARGYFPLFAVILALGIFGFLPRVRRSTKGEGTERRYFYGAVWAVTTAQTLLLVLWKTMPRTHATDIVKLVVFAGALGVMYTLAGFGVLPRTRPILPGELMVAD
jgi:hypothetical protein